LADAAVVLPHKNTGRPPLYYAIENYVLSFCEGSASAQACIVILLLEKGALQDMIINHKPALTYIFNVVDDLTTDRWLFNELTLRITKINQEIERQTALEREQKSKVSQSSAVPAAVVSAGAGHCAPPSSGKGVRPVASSFAEPSPLPTAQPSSIPRLSSAQASMQNRLEQKPQTLRDVVFTAATEDELKSFFLKSKSRGLVDIEQAQVLGDILIPKLPWTNKKISQVCAAYLVIKGGWELKKDSFQNIFNIVGIKGLPQVILNEILQYAITKEHDISFVSSFVSFVKNVWGETVLNIDDAIEVAGLVPDEGVRCSLVAALCPPDVVSGAEAAYNVAHW